MSNTVGIAPSGGDAAGSPAAKKMPSNAAPTPGKGNAVQPMAAPAVSPLHTDQPQAAAPGFQQQGDYSGGGRVRTSMPMEDEPRPPPNPHVPMTLWRRMARSPLCPWCVHYLPSPPPLQRRRCYHRSYGCQAKLPPPQPLTLNL
jgi:hypothetical protein